jgi:lipoprotein-anchoring transpeptidase ErfK/SrfK
MTVTNAGAYASSSYLASAYGRSAATGIAAAAATANATADTTSASDKSDAATVVTLSAAAQAQLAAAETTNEAADKPASSNAVVADARAAIDALYTKAKVAAAIVDGKQTIDLGGLDRRSLYAIANNTGSQFTADEQKIAKKELQERFDAVLAPRVAVAQLTGDWNRVYQAALDHMKQAGPEEKESPTYKTQLAALEKAQQAALDKPGTMPSVKDDPVGAYVARMKAAEQDDVVRDFGDVASAARTELDRQAEAAAAKGRDLIFNSARRVGEMVNFSDFDNRSLSAIALNEGKQFSGEEVRAAKLELDQRTRQTLLTAFEQAGSTSDPASFSLGLLYSYQSMSAEERQAMNFTTDLRDMAVSQYQTTSSVISMLQQAAGGGGSIFG